jgi:DNA-binding CsgD family transcriptional regulator/tetratricopeptide (TPR) repeat protein
MPWQANSSRLVGRRAELGHLGQLVDGMDAAAAARLVLITGEAGVGKSRLVRETIALARDAGLTVFFGRSVPAGEAYRPLVEALSVALRDRSMPTDPGLRPYLPVLAALLPDARIEGRPDPRGGVVLGEAVLRLLTALAGRRGAMLVLEDLHWVDPDTLDVLRYLAHAADTSPLLVLATARDEVDPPAALLDLAASAQADQIGLRRLGDGDVESVIESCLASRPPAELVSFVQEHADGLPFLVEELLTGLAAVGALAPDGQLTGPLATNVPRTFAATVRRRLADLDPAARRVVDAAAVLGRRFDWRLIPEITGLSELAVLAGLRAAVASGLIAAGSGLPAGGGGPAGTGLSAGGVPAGTGVPAGAVPAGTGLSAGGGPPGAGGVPTGGEPTAGRTAGAGGRDGADTFRFRHALTCDAVRGDLLPPEHRALARAAATVVERRDPDACDLAAGLWVAGGEDARAARLFGYAGAAAQRRGALQTADALLSRAAALAADHPELRRETEVALLDALAAAGETDRALALGERLLTAGEASVRLTLAEVAVAAGRWEAAAAWLAGVGNPDDPRATVLAARLALADGDPADAQATAELALARAREQGRWAVACQALQVLGRVARVSDAEAARAAFGAAEQLAREHDLPVERVSALHELGTVDLLVDGSTGALEEALGLAQQAGMLGLAATLEVQLTATLLHKDADVALRHAQNCAELSRRLRMDQLRATALFFQAAAHAHRRDRAEMQRCVRAAEELAPDDLDVNAGIWGAVHAHVALIDDDRRLLAGCLDKAMAYYRRSPTTNPAPIRGLWALVRTLDDRDGPAARDEARPSVVNWENRALLGYADAVDAGRRGDTARANAYLAAADAAMAERQWWRHRIRLLLADAALADGWGDPVGWAREALPAFIRRGDDKLAAGCRDVLRRAGAPVPRQGRGDTPVPDQLSRCGVTSREMDVLRLVAQGMSNADIARRLVLSPRTVETHVANLLAKTGVDGRAGLTALVNRLRQATGGSTTDLAGRA